MGVVKTGGHADIVYLQAITGFTVSLMYVCMLRALF